MISFEPTLHQEPQSSDTEDEDLLLKFVHANPEVSLNLLLNHPKIYGFVYIVDGILIKAFLPRKSVDWSKNREHIAAVSGNPYDYTPFSNAYPILKSEIDKLLSLEKPAPSPALAPTVPNEVAIMDNKTVVTSTSTTQDVKLIEKNERLIAFLSISFWRPEYDRSGNIAALTPAQLTDEALELLATHSSTADRARALYDGLDVLATDISRERTYLSRVADLPYLSQTVLTYMLQTHFHLHAIDKNHDSWKKSFNLLSFSPSPILIE